MSDEIRVLVALSRSACAILCAIEASRSLVFARLRSPFGGATETFGSIQRLVADAARFQYTPEDLHVPKVRRFSPFLSLIPQTWARLESMRNLLDFIDHLERFVTNAFDGAVSLPQSTAAVLQVRYIYLHTHALTQSVFPRQS